MRVPVSGVTLVHLRGTLFFCDRLIIAVTGEPAYLSQTRTPAAKYKNTQGIRSTHPHADSIPVMVVTVVHLPGLRGNTASTDVVSSKLCKSLC
jgi:hypothetical protein